MIENSNQSDPNSALERSVPASPMPSRGIPVPQEIIQTKSIRDRKIP
jgi:hypothetical protein